MVSIAVEVLRSDRATVASPTSTLQTDATDTFAHSLLANVVESVPVPAPGPTNGSKDAVVAAVADVKPSTKNIVVDQEVSITTMKHLESQSGSDEVKGNAKPVVSGRAAAIVKGRSAAKNQSLDATKVAQSLEINELETSATSETEISGTKNLPVPETKKVEVSDAKGRTRSEITKPEMPEPKQLEEFEVKEQISLQEAGGIRKLDVSETKKIEVGGIKPESHKSVNSAADDTQVSDSGGVHTLPTQGTTDVPLNSVKAVEVQSIVLVDHPDSTMHRESAQPTLATTMTVGEREAKGSPGDKVRSVKLSVSTGDETSTVPGVVEQPKNGTAVIIPDLAASGPAGTGKQEAGVGSISAVHGGTGSPEQAGSPMVAHIANATGDSKAGVQQALDPEMVSYPISHNPADQHGATGESRPGFLTATPTSLEVGITNGTHGWLKIRAEMEGGLVTASLSSNSAAGQDILHRELPSLAAFLQDEKISVNTLVVKQVPTMDTSGANSDGSMRRQGEQSPRQDSDSAGREPRTPDESGWGRSETESMYESWIGFGGSGGHLPAMAAGNGGWLNVRV
jgi:hypothetical protein